MSRRIKYDWVLIEELYIAGKVNPTTGENMEWSYAELATKFKIKSRQTIKEHADKGDWKTKRESYLVRHKETIREALRQVDLPSIIEMRKMVLKSQLGTVAKYNKQLDADTVEVKPIDAQRSSEFIINEYNILFGIREKQAEPETDVKVKVEVEVKTHDILHRTSRLISGDYEEPDDDPGDKEE